jgi:hypothetical protein
MSKVFMHQGTHKRRRLGDVAQEQLYEEPQGNLLNRKRAQTTCGTISHLILSIE